MELTDKVALNVNVDITRLGNTVCCPIYFQFDSARKINVTIRDFNLADYKALSKINMLYTKNDTIVYLQDIKVPSKACISFEIPDSVTVNAGETIGELTVFDKDSKQLGLVKFIFYFRKSNQGSAIPEDVTKGISLQELYDLQGELQELESQVSEYLSYIKNENTEMQDAENTRNSNEETRKQQETARENYINNLGFSSTSFVDSLFTK